ncbi:Uma2 family endonuclease [Kitasatospora sp. GP82]|nr:Uma2 family endonuclease [Kitasatospora sp. GP82]
MGATMTAVPDWLIPPEGGFTADDLDDMPGLPPHTELIDGSLVFMSPQKYFHSLAVDLLAYRLRSGCPAHLRVVREMSVVLGAHDRPEPDVSVVRAQAVSESGDETGYQAQDVALAVEVVSPDPVQRDRDTKPRKYAEAGVPHFWRWRRGRGDGLSSTSSSSNRRPGRTCPPVSSTTG